MQQIPRTEVKRCFLLNESLKKGQEEMLLQSRGQFLRELDAKKGLILARTATQLDNDIRNIWLKRLRMYDVLAWYYGTCSIDDMGVWQGAKSLPQTWTRGSLRETAGFVEKAMDEGSLEGEVSVRLATMMRVADIFAEKRLLSPIVVSGEMSWGRENCTKMSWNIDDGCGRAIALTLTGRERIRVYAGQRLGNTNL